MYIVAKHEISDPAKFWAAAQEATPSIPEGVKLLQVLPSTSGSSAFCLWQAESLDVVKNLVESSVGAVSTNDYYEIDSGNAVGLPT